jgi:hypothetical protein
MLIDITQSFRFLFVKTDIPLTKCLHPAMIYGIRSSHLTFSTVSILYV